MGKGLWILLAAFVGLAVLGFLIDTLRFLIGVAILAAAAVLAYRVVRRRRGAGDR